MLALARKLMGSGNVSSLMLVSGISVVDESANALNSASDVTAAKTLNCGHVKTVEPDSLDRTPEASAASDGLHAKMLEQEARADLIGQFTPVDNALEQVEQFSLDAGVNAVDITADDTIETCSANAEDLLGGTISQHGFGEERVFDDGFTSHVSSFASVSETAIDETGLSVSFNHTATQSALARSLEPRQPKFMWEQSGFLGAVFGTDDIVDNLFPQPSLKHPHAAFVDLT